MRILLDECAPRPLKRELADYEICTVVEIVPLIPDVRSVLSTIDSGEVIEVRGS